MNMLTWAACLCWGYEGSSLQRPYSLERWELHGSILQERWRTSQQLIADKQTSGLHWQWVTFWFIAMVDQVKFKSLVNPFLLQSNFWRCTFHTSLGIKATTLQTLNECAKSSHSLVCWVGGPPQWSHAWYLQSCIGPLNPQSTLQNFWRPPNNHIHNFLSEHIRLRSVERRKYTSDREAENWQWGTFTLSVFKFLTAGERVESHGLKLVC